MKKDVAFSLFWLVYAGYNVGLFVLGWIVTSLLGFAVMSLCEVCGWIQGRKVMTLLPRPFSAIYCLFKNHRFKVKEHFRYLREDELWCERCHAIKFVKVVEGSLKLGL